MFQKTFFENIQLSQDIFIYFLSNIFRTDERLYTHVDTFLSRFLGKIKPILQLMIIQRETI